MYGGHWSSASGDITYLICHVTSLHYVIEGSFDFMSWSSSIYVTALPILLAICIVALDMFFNFSIDLKGSCERVM